MPKTPRKKLQVSLEEQDQQEQELLEETKKNTSSMKLFKPPEKWREIYSALKQHRLQINNKTPVDTMGCDKLYLNTTDEKNKRFHVLISLLLSSQTKDQITSEAVGKLHELVKDKDGITVKKVIEAKPEDLNACIQKVGFHRKKTQFMKQIAEILHTKYNDDIPQSIQDLLDLPGIGPKMAYLVMQSAWGQVEGIGVDTHVHRISNRLAWTPSEALDKGPEYTRSILESWLPKVHWADINHILVGHGQTICLPRNPLCSECPVNLMCPKKIK